MAAKMPPAITNIDLQVARRHAEIANLDDDLQSARRSMTM